MRGTAEQLITYVSQYLEGAADNWDHRRNRDRMGAPQEALADWLAALEDEFRPIESAILLRTKFKRITQGDGTLKYYVADFRSKRDEASAAGATIADEAARDVFVEGLTTVSIKQELWTKLTVDAMEMTCSQVIDRALRLDANITMERTLWHGLAQAIRYRFLRRSPAPRAPGHQGHVLSVAARLTWLGTVPTGRVLGPGKPLLPGRPGSPPHHRRSRHTPRLSTRRQHPPRPCRRRHSRHH